MVDSSRTLLRRHHFDLDSGTPSSTFCSLLRPRDVFGRRGHRLISVVEMRPWWSLRPRSSSAFVVRLSLSGGVVRVAEPCARTPASPSPFWEGALACHLESALRLGDERRVPPFAGAVSAPKGSETTLHIVRNLYFQRGSLRLTGSLSVRAEGLLKVKVRDSVGARAY